MILGAGINQVPLIEKARREGLETYVVSYAGSYPGIALADHFLELNTTDISSILDAAQQIGIDAILTGGTDVCIPCIGAVCDEMKLPGISAKAADIISFKGNFRRFMHENGFFTPRFWLAQNWEELKNQLNQMCFPLYMKPIDCSGSRGIHRIDTVDSVRLRACFDDAVSYSARKTVCAEEAIPGIEIGGDAVLWNGKVIALIPTVKFVQDSFVRGHFLPNLLSETLKENIDELLESICDKLEYRSGMLNFDIMIDGETPKIIELGARLGGNGISNIIEHCFDYDIEADAIRIALRENPLGFSPGTRKPCASMIFGAGKSGVFRSVSSLEEVRKKCDFVWKLFCAPQPGERVVKMENNTQQMGFALFDCGSPSEYETCCEKIQQALQIEIEVE